MLRQAQGINLEGSTGTNMRPGLAHSVLALMVAGMCKIPL